EEPAVEVEGLLGVEKAVEVGLLGQVADLLVLADVGGGLAEDERLAVGGEEQAEQQLDGGGLPRAVGAEEAEDFALADLDVEGPQGGLLLAAPEVAVDLGQLARFDDHIGGHEATSVRLGKAGRVLCSLRRPRAERSRKTPRALSVGTGGGGGN